MIITLQFPLLLYHDYFCKIKSRRITDFGNWRSSASLLYFIFYFFSLFVCQQAESLNNSTIQKLIFTSYHAYKILCMFLHYSSAFLKSSSKSVISSIPQDKRKSSSVTPCSKRSSTLKQA